MYIVPAVIAGAIVLGVLAAFEARSSAYAQSTPSECKSLDGKTVTASDIESLVRSNCAISAKGAVIRGDLKLDRPTFANADFSGARFNGDVDLSSATFSDGANFQGATFDKSVSFEGAAFAGQANFSQTVFRGGANFEGAAFDGGTNFQAAKFEDVAVFNTAIFQGETSCRRAENVDIPEGFADFRNTTFDARATFNDTVISSCISFAGSLFHGFAGFRGIHLDGDAVFQGVKFKRSVDFGESVIQGRFFFRGAEFTGGFQPPTSLQGATDLRWDDVKHAFPGGDRADWLGALHTFFSSGGQHHSAAKVSTAQRRHNLRIFVYYVPTAFLLVLLVFAVVYGIFMGLKERGTRLRNSGKLLLFSLDVLTPGVGHWRHDWGGGDAFPTGRVSAIIAAESAIGWVILAISSAVFVAWIGA
jgi:hypothetical protein